MDSRTTPSYGTPNNPQNQGHASGYPPPYPVDGIQNNAPTAPYPPMEAYPPVSTAYPPMSTAYPPPMSTAYPPPTTAPPPYSDAIPNYPTTNVTNTTIVLISQPDPYIPEVGFNSKTIRLGFIRRVFAILSIQLLVTVAFVCLFLFVPAFKRAGKTFPVYIAAYIIFLVLYFVLVCCDGVRRNHPTNLILLSLFTLSLSYLVGVISSFHDTNIVLVMMGVTAIVTICVFLFACQTRFDMTKFGGVLFVLSLVIFFVLIFSPAFLLVTNVSRIAIGGVLALLFTAFMIYDVQLVMGGKKYELNEEEYVFGALILYIDIIYLFVILLYFFGGSSN